MTPPRSMRTPGPEVLGTDLAALVAMVGSPLLAATPITGLPSATLARATFRLEFADGQVLKGRRFDTPADAERLELLTRALAPCSLPRVQARQGPAVLEEWVPGVPLDRLTPGRSRLRQAGALLGAIHGVGIVPSSVAGLPPVIATPLTVDERRAATARGIDALARIGRLPAPAARRLRDLLEAHAPSDRGATPLPRGIVHRDFCPENIVLAKTGQLWVVDNGTVTVDAYAFDLARTWYRWPMTPERWDAFAGGYRQQRGTEDFTTHFPFWTIAVLVDAALFRHQAETPGALEPVRRLDALLAAIGPSGNPDPTG